jgi:hypothetical protein
VRLGSYDLPNPRLNPLTTRNSSLRCTGRLAPCSSGRAGRIFVVVRRKWVVLGRAKDITVSQAGIPTRKCVSHLSCSVIYILQIGKEPGGICAHQYQV